MSSQVINSHVLLSSATSATGTWYPLNFTNNEYVVRNIFLSVGSGSMFIEATPDRMLVAGSVVQPVNFAIAASVAATGKQWVQITGPFAGVRARCTGSGKAIGLI